MDELWLARHGETEWSLSKRHTGITDLELTERGVIQARALGARLKDDEFDLVISSPLIRARRTAELAGYENEVVLDDDLIEYRYGDYEGMTTPDIRAERPGWSLWDDGCPGGEVTDDVARRADRVLERARGAEGKVLVFGHGHMSRVLAARFLGLEGRSGSLFILGTAALSILGYEHERPAVSLWNDNAHLEGIT